MTTRTFTVFDDRELVGFLQDEPEPLGIADALVASLGPESVGRRAATARRRTNGLPPAHATPQTPLRWDFRSVTKARSRCGAAAASTSRSGALRASERRVARAVRPGGTEPRWRRASLNQRAAG